VQFFRASDAENYIILLKKAGIEFKRMKIGGTKSTPKIAIEIIHHPKKLNWCT